MEDMNISAEISKKSIPKLDDIIYLLVAGFIYPERSGRLRISMPYMCLLFFKAQTARFPLGLRFS